MGLQGAASRSFSTTRPPLSNRHGPSRPIIICFRLVYSSPIFRSYQLVGASRPGRRPRPGAIAAPGRDTATEPRKERVSAHSGDATWRETEITLPMRQRRSLMGLRNSANESCLSPTPCRLAVAPIHQGDGHPPLRHRRSPVGERATMAPRGWVLGLVLKDLLPSRSSRIIAHPAVPGTSLKCSHLPPIARSFQRFSGGFWLGAQH